MLSDAHCHYDGAGALATIQQQENVAAIVNCGSPTEWRQNKAFIGTAQYLSFGIHPWTAPKYDETALLPYFNQAQVIGEIGLDTVWTDVPLAMQQPVFEAQLVLAERLHKPVILHTKGAEVQCLAALRRHPNRYFVHWYSSATLQAEYVAAGCYMSIGVDVVNDPAVQALAKRVPTDRLLLESDGLDSIAWAWQRPVTVAEYPEALGRSAQVVGQLRGEPVAMIQQQAASNLHRFIDG